MTSSLGSWHSSERFRPALKRPTIVSRSIRESKSETSEQRVGCRGETLSLNTRHSKTLSALRSFQFFVCGSQALLGQYSTEFLFIVVVFIVLAVDTIVALLGRNAIALLRPSAEIDEPATLRAKWPIRVILPWCFFAAAWTFDCTKHGTLVTWRACLPRRDPRRRAFFPSAPDRGNSR